MLLTICTQRIINLVASLLTTHDFNPYIGFTEVHLHRALKFPLAPVYKLIYDCAPNTRGCIYPLVFNVLYRSSIKYLN